MKNAAKKWYNYLFALAGVAFLVGLAIGLHYVIGDKDWPLNYSWYFMIFGGVAFLLVGFIIQDLYRAWNRHKLHDWDNPLPEKIIHKAWNIYFPLFTSGLLTFVVGLLAYLISK